MTKLLEDKFFSYAILIMTFIICMGLAAGLANFDKHVLIGVIMFSCLSASVTLFICAFVAGRDKK